MAHFAFDLIDLNAHILQVLAIMFIFGDLVMKLVLKIFHCFIKYLL